MLFRSVLVSSDGRLVNLPSAHADARGGTLFLDAVWALDEAQQRLFLDLISMDTPRTVRLIVGSDRYLWPLVESGYFSEALFYRLNALHITRAAARPWS